MKTLQDTLDHTFRDPALLERALTHRSFSEESAQECRHNERLEFLGDAVLELAVTQLLFRELSQASEGDLSRIRASLVRTESLARVGAAWDLGPLLRLGRGEEGSGGRGKDSLLANAVEALLGALYLDGGLAPCLALIEGTFGEAVRNIQDPAEFGRDPKSRLQEETMRRFRLLPRYKVVDTSGPAHARSFRVCCQVGEQIETTGVGPSKRAAERAAARAALEELS
jgi:ribonuclease-3